jgi:4a-hydroxytetrahydrobiopterin dehydratase
MRYLKRFESMDEKLREEFNFKDVEKAIEFMKSSCDVFTDLNHHPDLFSLKGKTIHLELTTHSEGGVTEKDFEVVERLEDLISDCCKPLNPHLFTT